MFDRPTHAHVTQRQLLGFVVGAFAALLVLIVLLG